MPADPRRVKEVFGEALEIAEADVRRAFLDRACGPDAELRRGIDALLAANDAPASAPGAAAGGGGGDGLGGASGQRARRGHGHRRPVQAARGDRRGRHGRGLAGRADRAGQAAGGAQAHQAGHGLEAGAGPLRGRAAGAGADGPPEHRPGARRRHHRRRAGRSSSWSWSRACRSPSTATSSRLLGPRAAGAVRAGLPGGAARPPEGDHPPRPQAVATCWSPMYDGRPVPKVIDFGVAKATEPAADRPDAVHRLRGDRRHAGVHVARAGRRCNQLDIDTRTDVYALGVLLYELLDRHAAVRPRAAAARRPWTRCCGWSARRSRRGRAPG